ncbi:stalk domain-containing protein [Desulforamulus aeronauticus]|uniref:stalk domain-containing protein n=1 Tax=Desulforamulus aeronauticus TaxID=53343 RepID=UPI003B75C4D0
MVDGKPLSVSAVIENGTTLVPIRSIFESLQAEVTWDQTTQTVTAVKDNFTLQLQVGSLVALRNGQPISLQVPGKIIESSTMVPLRFVSESLGAEVRWDEPSKTVVIQSKDLGSQEIIIQSAPENADPLYNKILQALLKADESITFDTTNRNQYGSTEKVIAVAEKVLQDHPYLNHTESFEIRINSGNSQQIKITFHYNFPSRDVREMNQAVDEKAREIIKRVIQPGMTELEKEKALHDYVVLNTKFDYENYQKGTIAKESYTAYGVLVKGVGVCQGYASAMCKLLPMVGIECRMMVGTGKTARGAEEPHGWNLVKIEGQWYHLDVNWDDPIPDQPGAIRYTYFNLSDQEIKKDHSWSEQPIT